MLTCDHFSTSLTRRRWGVGGGGLRQKGQYEESKNMTYVDVRNFSIDVWITHQSQGR